MHGIKTDWLLLVVQLQVEMAIPIQDQVGHQLVQEQKQALAPMGHLSLHGTQQYIFAQMITTTMTQNLQHVKNANQDTSLLT